MNPQPPSELSAQLEALRLTPVSGDPRLFTSKNTTVLCVGSGGARFLVKHTADWERSGLRREAAVLGQLGRFRRGGVKVVSAPELHPGSARRRLLAVSWIEGETLYARHRRLGRLEPRVLAEIGRTLRVFHDLGRAPAMQRWAARHLEPRPLFISRLLWTPPDLYARLSPGGLAFVAHVQRSSKEARDALVSIARAGEVSDATLVHGDVKPANVVRDERGRIVLIDWELARWGDPASDLGSLAAELLLSWLAADAPPAQLSVGAVARALDAMLRGYGLKSNELTRRVVRWAGVSMLSWVYSGTHYQGRFDRLTRLVCDQALRLVADPEQGRAQIWSRR